MEIYYHARFLKNYRKRITPSKKLQILVKEKIDLLMQNPFNPVLKNHPLKGARKNNRSFSVNADIRIIFREISESRLLLLDIGSHNQVY
jgi:addiction module RelE/StbE family toxin